MEAAPEKDWHAADKVYQAHHAGCATCRAAGANPDTTLRCQAGAELWATYQAAGTPPHFAWIKPRPERKP